ncbi:hypothetical protein NE237_014552 [Protea cynaroides]|uniref:Uncharacterized protein n=1 Tax=Protea cynaroides TaxID=273540 RepID=A0A9Q0KCJ0_9MAGN|nr:hypothetical protein NE237_014552 [Protea cynaroides]
MWYCSSRISGDVGYKRIQVACIRRRQQLSVSYFFLSRVSLSLSTLILKMGAALGCHPLRRLPPTHCLRAVLLSPGCRSSRFQTGNFAFCLF